MIFATNNINKRWKDTNMVVSLMTAGSWLQRSPCIVSYSDIVYHPSIIKKLCVAEDELAIIYDSQWYRLWEDRFVDPLSDAETFATDNLGYLTKIGKHSTKISDINGQYMGLLKFTPNSWAKTSNLLREIETEERDKMDMTALLGRLISRDVPIKAIAVEGQWCEVDTIDDLNLYEKNLAQENPWMHDWRF